MNICRGLGTGLLVTLSVVAAACGSTSKSSDAKAPTAAETTAAVGGANAGTAAAGSTVAAPTLKTRDRGKLTACSDIPYAPFEYYENGADGKVVGIDADLIGAIARRVGLTIELKKTPFDGIFAALAANQCDMIASSVSITEERKKANDFSEPYFTIHQSILVRAADATITDLPGLAGKIVGAQSATTGAAFANKGASANGYSVKEFQGADELFTALKARQVDAVIQDAPINGYAATRSNGELLVTKVFEGAGEGYGFVVPKDNPDLTKAINDSLAKLKADGTYRTILESYLGDATGIA